MSVHPCLSNPSAIYSWRSGPHLLGKNCVWSATRGFYLNSISHVLDNCYMCKSLTCWVFGGWKWTWKLKFCELPSFYSSVWPCRLIPPFLWAPEWVLRKHKTAQRAELPDCSPEIIPSSLDIPRWNRYHEVRASFAFLLHASSPVFSMYIV